MGNTYFKYKRFTINQEKCAMKVCTDSSYFGGLIEPNNPSSILDIGTGTGVLSLMIAQKSEGDITAIEIDKEAALQAKENFNSSEWSNKLSVVNEDVIKFSETHNSQFDLIISNPPFFQNSMLANASKKNLARHDTSLTLEQLANCITNLLNIKGEFWVLLPQYESSILEKELENNHLFATRHIKIKNYSEDTKISRVVSSYSFDFKEVETIEVAIYKDKTRDYTDYFVSKLKDYYLYL